MNLFIYILFFYLKQCNTCKEKIKVSIERFTYENLNWHATSDCFKCYTCNKDLLETHFLLKNNLLFCSIDCKSKVINRVDNKKKSKK